MKGNSKGETHKNREKNKYINNLVNSLLNSNDNNTIIPTNKGYTVTLTPNSIIWSKQKPLKPQPHEEYSPTQNTHQLLQELTLKENLINDLITIYDKNKSCNGICITNRVIDPKRNIVNK